MHRALRDGTSNVHETLKLRWTDGALLSLLASFGTESGIIEIEDRGAVDCHQSKEKG